jgi:2-oxoglutarate ferredoxin oxidoreductase subunit beta
VHDAGDHNLAFALSRLSDQDLPTPSPGIFRDVRRTTYDDAAARPVAGAVTAAEAKGGPTCSAAQRPRHLDGVGLIRPAGTAARA